jgi:ornithine cyclodeaminase/alanine dehydrogenase-like protein (mu-crystallin family)
MPGYMEDPAVLGLKVVNAFAASPEDATVTNAVIVLFDPETGSTEGVIEASYLTAIRTAAMTQVAYRYAAPAEVRTVGMIGSGVQARAHAAYLAEAFPRLEELRVFSRNPQHADAFADSVGDGGFGVRATRSAEEAVVGADVVVAATTAHRPVFEDDWLAPGALVCGIGTHTADAAEIPAATVGRADSVIVDTRVGGIYGAGDISQPLASEALSEESIVELGELVLGTRTLLRNGGVTVFKSVGTAAADLPLAHAMVERARKEGIGVEVDF